MSTDKPNILVIMSDQHSTHVAGCYGNSIVRTPNIDRLASRGIRMDNAYCGSPLCVPSRMSFMTGRTPSRNRVWTNNHVLNSGIPTFAHVLGLAGYETALIGRMHFVGPDQRHGFQKRPFGEFHSRHVGAKVRGGPLWTKYPESSNGQGRAAVNTVGTGHTHYQWYDLAKTRAACDYLLKDRDKGKPFAALVGYMLPHCPFVAPKELYEYYYSRVDVPQVEEELPAIVEQWRRARKLDDPPLTVEHIRRLRAAYFALCEFTDIQVGKVLQALEESGEVDKTLVIYTSDHGELAGEHGCWWKSMFYEASASVPMIARGPGIRPGCASDAVCNLYDLAPTLAEAGGTRFESLIDGRSLLPIFQGQTPADWPNETFSELVDFKMGGLPQRMIRQGDWKLCVYDKPESQRHVLLYNLKDDPGELHNLADNPTHATTREALLARVYQGWDPAAALASSMDQEMGFKTLRLLGNLLDPRHEDEVVVPSDQYEADVELFPIK